MNDTRTGWWTATPPSLTLTPALRSRPDGGLDHVGGLYVSAGRRDLWWGQRDADGAAPVYQTAAVREAVGAFPGRARGDVVVPTGDGGRFIVGRFLDYIGPGQDNHSVLIVRVDAANQVQWSVRYHDNSYWTTEPVDAVAMPDGGLLIAGSTRHDPWYWAEDRGLLLRVDADGQKVWDMAGTAFGQLAGITPLPDGTFLVYGASHLSQGKPWYARVDVDGRLLWTRYFATTLGGFSDAAPLADGGVAIAAFTDANEAAVVNVDPQGAVRWIRAGDIDPGEIASSAAVTAVPATCGTAPVAGDACADPGAWCASGALQCRCDGAWVCEAGSQDVVLGWAHAAGGVSSARVAAFTAAGALRGLRGSEHVETVDDLTTDRYGRVRWIGAAGGSDQAFIETNGALDGCGWTDVSAAGASAVTAAGTAVTYPTFGAARNLYLGTAVVTAAAGAPATVTLGCEGSACPQP